jgi:hypothetical protein
VYVEELLFYVERSDKYSNDKTIATLPSPLSRAPHPAPRGPALVVDRAGATSRGPRDLGAVVHRLGDARSSDPRG